MASEWISDEKLAECLALYADKPDDLAAIIIRELQERRAQIAAKDAVIQKVVAEIREKAEKYREFERLARNGGMNSVMDSSAGKASGLFLAARMIEAALALAAQEKG